MPMVAVMARVRIRRGRSAEYLSAFAPLLEQARREVGTLLYVVHRAIDDADVFWTSEIYADAAAFAQHRSSDVHAAATPLFQDLIDEVDVVVGECLAGKGIPV